MRVEYPFAMKVTVTLSTSETLVYDHVRWLDARYPDNVDIYLTNCTGKFLFPKSHGQEITKIDIEIYKENENE